MDSLLDYANDPGSVPSPLPAHHKRRHVRGWQHDWPVGLLPGEALALDLTRQGVTYLHGRGYALSGSPLEAPQVARLVADLMDTAATALGPWVEAFGLDGLDEFTVVDDDLRDTVRALRLTADAIRVSARAQTNLVTLIRPHLSAPVKVDENAASDFLAGYDARPPFRRASLAVDYFAVGAPGALTKSVLFERATDRWGPARKTSGHPTYFPSRAASSPTAPLTGTALSADLDASAIRWGIDAEALASFVASATPTAA